VPKALRAFLLFVRCVASSFVFGNDVRHALLVELLSFPIHLFEDLLIEQAGFTPALAVPSPGVFPE
jgi:hypothetical protein